MSRLGSSGNGGPWSFLDPTKITLILSGTSTDAPVQTTYTTIQDAVNAVPAGTDSTTIRRVATIFIPEGTYDEDITIDITRRHIQLLGMGAVNIGLFNNTFWAASSSRSITVNCTDSTIDSVRSTLGIGTLISYATGSTTHPAYSASFRISGNIVWNVTSSSFTDVEMYLSGDVFGNIDTSSAVTHNHHMYFTKARVRGSILGTRNLLQLADWSVFDNLVSGHSYSTLRHSVFSGGMTMTSASSGGFKPFGMFACDFSGTFTGPASSLVLDNTTDYFFTANAASLAGGATKIFVDGAGAGISQLTGDVTAGPGSGSVAATIANNAVTNAKLAQMAANTVKANITGSTSNATDAVLTSAATNNSVAQRDSAGNLVATSMLSTLFKPSDGAGTAVTFTGGSAASNGNGGNSTLSGAAGSSVGTGGNGGNVTITGGSANGDNTVDRSGGSVTINGGASKGSNQGGGFTVNLGAGGPGTGTAGATGGTNNINAGTGGIGSSTSGAGGNSTINAGTGGAGTAGGNGGTATLHGGTGGTGSSSGGNGGPANVTGGTASNNAGSAGGSVTLAAAGGSSTGAGGAGGTVTITGGNAGGDNSSNNNGGSITITSGNAKGSANGAAINLNGGTGGLGTGTTGANGGAITLTSGAGGLGSSTGGNGADLTLKAGVGGNSGTPGNGGNIIFSTGATTSVAEHLRVSNTGNTQLTNGNLLVQTAGFGIQVKSGSNCKTGTATLVVGTATVSNTSITANSRILLTSQSDGGVVGFLRITAKSVGTSFTITSSSALDTSTVMWYIIEAL